MSNLIEENVAVMTTSAEATATLEKFVKGGYAPISNGLGLPDGKYVFITATSDYMGMFAVTSRAKGAKMALPFVFGVAEGIDTSNENITKTFEDTNRCVIPTESWKQVQPDTEYEMTVRNNYVVGFVLFEEGTQTADEPETVVETPAPKATPRRRAK